MKTANVDWWKQKNDDVSNSWICETEKSWKNKTFDDDLCHMWTEESMFLLINKKEFFWKKTKYIDNICEDRVVKHICWSWKIENENVSRLMSMFAIWEL